MINIETQQLIQKLERFCKKEIYPFKTNEDILEIALAIFKLRRCIHSDDKHNPALPITAIISKASEMMHQCINRSKSTSLVSIFREYRLTRLETEIMLVMILYNFAMLEEKGRRQGNIELIQKYVNNGSFKTAVRIKQALRDDSRLFRFELLIADGKDDLLISDSIIEMIIDKKKAFKIGWNIKTYDELLDRIFECIKIARSHELEIGVSYETSTQEPNSYAKLSNISRLVDKFAGVLSQHPSWKLNDLIKADLTQVDRFIVLLLIGKELGFCSPQDTLFTGLGLARSISTSVPQVRNNLYRFTHDSPLQRDGYMRVCGGSSNNPAIEDDATLQSCEFEITTEYLKKLNIKRRGKSGISARQPIIKLDQLVLPEKALSSIIMALNHIRNHRILFDKWGLGNTICYGRGVTLLFSGSPGTGKTACAEAIADELNKLIIPINYAELQSCWVGQTEKNIVRAFREAAEADAVLFWDEADAMFYDRESATRNWEVRDVNVLLQELERYEGVCILSTNRKTQLDKALERRLSMKIDFEPPTRQMRLKIWQKLIPQKFPLAKDVDFAQLSHERLTGGEIKNTILNAARIALKRGPQTKVCKADFMEAIQMEKQGSWSRSHERFGFRAKSEVG